MDDLLDIATSPLIIALIAILVTYLNREIIADLIQAVHELSMDRLGGLRLPSLWTLLGSRGEKRDSSDLSDASIDEGEDGSSGEGSKPAAGGYYPGLVNVGGVSCFLNATLQALDGYLASITELDDDAQLSMAVLDLVRALNTPSKSGRTLSASVVARALYSSNASTKQMFGTREQQAADELFVLLAGAIDDEREAAERARRATKPYELRRGILNPLRSLMASRVGCLQCGYVEAVRHLPEDYVPLIVPVVNACRLEDMLNEAFKLELIEEFNCRPCALRSAHAKLLQQAERMLSPAADSVDVGMSSSKKKRRREVIRCASAIEVAIQEDPQRDLSDIVKIEPSISRASKQTVFARPAKALIFHLNRSANYGPYGPIKNGCRVVLPEILDLSPFTYRADQPQRPDRPMSGSRTTASTPVLYRLVSFVVHFGSHSFGHYVAFRRRPDGLEGDDEWLRISDDAVRPATTAEALNANPFLVMYERFERKPSVIEALRQAQEQTPTPEDDGEGKLLPPPTPTLKARTVNRFTATSSRRGVSPSPSDVSEAMSDLLASWPLAPRL